MSHAIGHNPFIGLVMLAVIKLFITFVDVSRLG